MVVEEQQQQQQQQDHELRQRRRQEVPLVPAELSRPATAHACVDVLLHLEAVVEQVFGGIMKRLADTTGQLEAVRRRAADAQAKVDRLTGINKATQVFSSAQYPGGEEYRPYTQVHAGTAPPLPFQSTTTPSQDPQTPPTHSTLQDKLQFFHIRERKSGGGGGGGGGGGRRRGGLGGLVGEETDREDGLGRLPPHLTSVSSLLLFNTNHNPYKKYMVLDPLGVVSGTRGVAPRSRAGTGTPAPQALQDAPTTLQDADLGRGLVNKDGYQYLPDLSDMPDLELPMELPFLTGVANDLLFEGGPDATIAPSLTLHDGPPAPFPSTTTTTTPNPATTTTTTKPPPPQQQPPPAPPAPTTTTTTTSTAAATAPPPAPPQAPPTATAAPPPPPPPPPPAPAPPPPPPPPPPASGAVPENVPAVALTEARSDLMRAIQEAGGVGKAKLKSAKQGGGKARKKGAAGGTDGGGGGSGEEKVTQKAPAGDLMSDLFNRLSQRRKGISGAQKNPPSEAPRPPPPSGGSTMERLSSFIPPPPLTSNGGEEGKDGEGSDEDWD